LAVALELGEPLAHVGERAFVLDAQVDVAALETKVRISRQRAG